MASSRRASCRWASSRRCRRSAGEGAVSGAGSSPRAWFSACLAGSAQSWSGGRRGRRGSVRRAGRWFRGCRCRWPSGAGVRAPSRVGGPRRPGRRRRRRRGRWLLAGAAHGDVGELAAAAVVEAVRGVDGGALGAVHGRGVPVVQAVGGHVLGREELVAAVVHAGHQLAAVGVDGGDGAAFAGHDRPAGAGSEGDDAVAGGVAAPAGRFEFGAVEAPIRRPGGPGCGVEGGDVVAPPRVQAAVEA